MKLGGQNTGNGLHISSGGSLTDYYLSPEVVGDSVEADSLKRAAEIARGIQTIFSREDEQHYRRIRKGLNALLRGIREGDDAAFRLHQFVRAVEAVIKPDAGRTTKQFVHRSAFLAGRTNNDRALMRMLFEMRSAAEHLNPLSDLINEHNAHERNKLIALRVFQAEILAGYLYCRLLTDLDLLQDFSTDENISAFWAGRDDELIQTWGRPIDLEGSIEWKFDMYLSRR